MIAKRVNTHGDGHVIKIIHDAEVRSVRACIVQQHTTINPFHGKLWCENIARLLDIAMLFNRKLNNISEHRRYTGRMLSLIVSDSTCYVNCHEFDVERRTKSNNKRNLQVVEWSKKLGCFFFRGKFITSGRGRKVVVNKFLEKRELSNSKRFFDSWFVILWAVRCFWLILLFIQFAIPSHWKCFQNMNSNQSINVDKTRKNFSIPWFDSTVQLIYV